MTSLIRTSSFSRSSRVGFDIPYRMVEGAVDALSGVYLVYTGHLLHADKAADDSSVERKEAL